MSEFVEHVAEILEPLGPVRARRMFGAHGIFHGGTMFALVAGDVLYLKTDAATARELEGLGSRAFEYARRGRTVRLSYHSAPEGILDDREATLRWARRALDAALRSRTGRARGG